LEAVLLPRTVCRLDGTLVGIPIGTMMILSSLSEILFTTSKGTGIKVFVTSEQNWKG
jgi:hypothetical protein